MIPDSFFRGSDWHLRRCNIVHCIMIAKFFEVWRENTQIKVAWHGGRGAVPLGGGIHG